ncbi:hypothetical protein LTR70_003146 [Exophiala xenobiotica]|uniref:Metallo-beta-lactamase domain-containing protein n=1 Tax=Lithohypha guttulata TaxID=1690604 RepID=A0ABR0KH39_9EURO|nr:hypothetical protein LTR24_002622 [Lithohypha guttulata]KAK5323857.1 hypothetical protein LTR70_003146 [Exophiala xenobiotica]
MILGWESLNSPLGLPQVTPELDIPESTATVDVRIINTTTYQRTKTENLFGKAVVGHENLSFPSYSFLVSNAATGVNILFDLGMRRDWWKSCPPGLAEYISDYDSRAPLQVCVETDVADILDTDLAEFGITSTSIAAVIWSHHHFDHRGDMSRFPKHTRLIIGPGLLKAHGHELNKSDVCGRDVFELAEQDFPLEIGGFPAHDAFGDGSFYLLSCPGHSVGHLAALARVTTSPRSTYVFLGGDCAHHCGEFRPSPYEPLPQQVSFRSSTYSFENIISTPQSPRSPTTFRTRKPVLCAGEFVAQCVHPRQSPTEPFYQTPREPVVHNYIDADDSVQKLQAFDAHDDVLVCISHDSTLMNVLPFYPNTINQWHRKRYKQRLKWEFLNDFDVGGKKFGCGRKFL